MSLDADWLETDVVVVEFRLLCRALPESSSRHGDQDASPDDELAQDEAREVCAGDDIFDGCA